MSQALQIIQDPTLTYHQQLLALARLGESTDTSLRYSEAYYAAKAKGALCDLNEGVMPYRPRYICPDYALLFEKGCDFLQLDPPGDLAEALNVLEIFYCHVPSITSFPVYLGDLDKLLEPFVLREDRAYAKKLLRLFLRNIDRVQTDSFVHADLGPEDSVTGRLLLELTEEMQLAIPNLTLKYDPDITPDDFASKAISTSLVSANPAFALDPAYKKAFGDIPYGIASCYNGLPIGGGAYLLHRLNLGPVAVQSKDTDDFFNNTLPHAVRTMCGFMEDCIRFLVEESAFFRSCFLVKEGLIDPDRFIGLFGMVGLSEAVDQLMLFEGSGDKFGETDAANEMGVRVMDRLQELVNEHTSAYSKAFDHKFMLHAQVGLGEVGVTPGVRIPIGREIPLYDHLRQAGLYHPYFQTGVGDIFPFEVTAKKNPEAVLDIFKGAFKVGMRYISTYAEDSDLIRVTGYLVKKSEVFALHDEGKVAINDMSSVAYNTIQMHHTLDRKVRSIDGSAG